MSIKRSLLCLQFAELGGFEEIKKQIETADKVDAPVRCSCTGCELMCLVDTVILSKLLYKNVCVFSLFVTFCFNKFAVYKFQMLAALLKPLGICASYLNAKVLPVKFFQLLRLHNYKNV